MCKMSRNFNFLDFYTEIKVFKNYSTSCSLFSKKDFGLFPKNILWLILARVDTFVLGEIFHSAILALLGKIL